MSVLFTTVLLVMLSAPDSQFAPAVAETEPIPAVWLTTSQTPSPDDLAPGWLVVRLMEEGYVLADRAEHANLELAVEFRGIGQGWVVTATGVRSNRSYDVASGDDASVAKLELLHRSVDALESVRPRPNPQDPTPARFAIELSAEVSADAREATKIRIAHAVVQAGGMLAPTRQAAEFVLCTGRLAGELELVTADVECAQPTTENSLVRSGTQRAKALVASVLVRPLVEVSVEQVPQPASDVEQPPLRKSSNQPPSQRRVWPNSLLVLRGGVAGGAIARGGGVDAVAAVSGTIGREPGLAAWVELQTWPSVLSGVLRVVEIVPAVGLRLRPFTRGRVAWDIGSLLGLQIHTYRFRFRDPAAGRLFSNRGAVLDWSLEAATGVSIRLWSLHELQILLRGGATGRTREHRFEGAPLWRRAPFRLGVTIGFNFGQRLGA